jgi:hypothetical protein
VEERWWRSFLRKSTEVVRQVADVKLVAHGGLLKKLENAMEP